MTTHCKDPGAAEQSLMLDLKGALKRHADQGMQPIVALAVLAQLLGQVVADVDAAQYETADIMAAVAGNIEAGNKVANEAKKGSSSSGLVGFGGAKLQ